MHVSLNDHMLNDPAIRCMDGLLRCELLRVTRQKNPLSLTRGLRLDYESSVPLFVHLVLELLEICWQIVCLWEKVVVLGENGLEAR